MTLYDELDALSVRLNRVIAWPEGGALVDRALALKSAIVRYLAWADRAPEEAGLARWAETRDRHMAQILETARAAALESDRVCRERTS